MKQSLLLLTPFVLVPMLAGSASADVHVLNASMDGAQEVPPAPTTATGSAVITVDDVSGYVQVSGSYTGLNAAAAAAHLHGPAAPGSNAGILLALTATGGTSGTFSGAGLLTSTQVSAILSGMSYVNVHTGSFPGGEIRGQGLYPLITVDGTLDGAQQNPPVNTNATGTFSVDIDRNTAQVSVSGTYSNLSVAAGNAHLHGPAFFGSNGGIFIGLQTTGGTNGTFSGAAFVTASQLDDIVDGFSYVNVHNSMFPGGEIRGQVFGPTWGTSYCDATDNSTNAPATMSATGSPQVADNDVELTVTNLPNNQFGYFIASQGSNQIFPVANSQGRLCIAGSAQARFNASLSNSGGNGTISAMIDITAIPANPTVSAVPGDTWNFQLWYRDLNPGPVSNFSKALSLSFR